MVISQDIIKIINLSKNMTYPVSRRGMVQVQVRFLKLNHHVDMLCTSCVFKIKSISRVLFSKKGK